MRSVDFEFEYHGSLWLVRPTTADAREHLMASVSEDAQWFGGALVVEPRYVDALASGLEGDGFTTEV